MPTCKNDKHSTYTGDEPSPKGLGFCAHAEKINTKMIGKDKNSWIISVDKNNTKRWIKYNIESLLSDNNRSKNLTNIENTSKDEIVQLFSVLLKKNTISGDLVFLYQPILKQLWKFKLDMSDLIFTKITSMPKMHIHKININKTILICDPSSTLRPKKKSSGFISDIEFNVKPGNWFVYYQSWITNNPNICTIVHSDYFDKDVDYKLIKQQIGVDTAQLSILDIDDYIDDVDVREKKYSLPFISTAYFRKFTNGYTVKSGFGDGFYPITTGVKNNQIIKIMIYFIF